MAWLGLGNSRIRGASLDTESDGPDIPVAPRPSWLLVGMILVSTGALLATTNEQVTYGYNFETTTDGKPARLSATAPSAKFSIKVIVNARGPSDADTSNGVRLTIHGTVTPNPAPLGSGVFVDAQLGGRAGTGAPPLSVLTEFDFGQELPFFGDCVNPGGATPCAAQATFSLSRDDAGAQGGALDVAWNATFDGTARARSKVDPPPSEPPPWTIEVTPL